MPASLYPANRRELDVMFETEENCLRYLAGIRWPNGFECIKCKGKVAYLTARHLLHCKECGRQKSVTEGTLCFIARGKASAAA